MERLGFLCFIAIFLSLVNNGKSSGFACTVNQTHQEEINIKEKTQANFSYQLREDTGEISKESLFIIEIKLCEDGTYYDACRCRWLSDNNPTCKNKINVSVCEADNSEMRFSLFVERTHSGVLWELYRKQSTPLVLKNTKLQVIYPAKVTGLQVNGKEANKTQVIDENQKVSISCSFTNGNPLVTVHLWDDTGRGQSSTSHGEGPLTLSLGVFHCHEVWPTVRCQAPGSELNRSVTILGKCVPKFLHIGSQLLDLSSVLYEGLTLRLRSYTTNIRKCLLTKLPPEQFSREVKCELSGSVPEFNLTLHLATASWIGQGIWTLHALTELGDSNITFVLINGTVGGRGPAIINGSNRTVTSNTATECNTYKETAIQCKFTKDLSFTKTDFAVYFYSDNGKGELLIDCGWLGGKLECVEQEGLELKQPVSDIAEISVPTRFRNKPGSFICLPEDDNINDSKPCQFVKKKQKDQTESIQDSVNKSHPDQNGNASSISTIVAITGSVLGTVAIAIVTVILFKRRKKRSSSNNKSQKSGQFSKDENSDLGSRLTEESSPLSSMESGEVKPFVTRHK